MTNQREFRTVELIWKAVVAMDARSLDCPCVYQVYGDSQIYGKNVLVYIGQAGHGGHRIGQHLDRKTTVHNLPNPTFRVAECPAEMLTELESTLIAMHKPSRNSEFIMTAVRRDPPLLIFNHGDKGDLELLSTNMYWKAIDEKHEPTDSDSSQ